MWKNTIFMIIYGVSPVDNPVETVNCNEIVTFFAPGYIRSLDKNRPFV